MAIAWLFSRDGVYVALPMSPTAITSVPFGLMTAGAAVALDAGADVAAVTKVGCAAGAAGADVGCAAGGFDGEQA